MNRETTLSDRGPVWGIPQTTRSEAQEQRYNSAMEDTVIISIFDDLSL